MSQRVRSSAGRGFRDTEGVAVSYNQVEVGDKKLGVYVSRELVCLDVRHECEIEVGEKENLELIFSVGEVEELIGYLQLAVVEAKAKAKAKGKE